MAELQIFDDLVIWKFIGGAISREHCQILVHFLVTSDILLHSHGRGLATDAAEVALLNSTSAFREHVICDVLDACLVIGDCLVSEFSRVGIELSQRLGNQ